MGSACYMVPMRMHETDPRRPMSAPDSGLRAKLASHAEWLASAARGGPHRGEPLDATGAYLRGLDMRGAQLTEARLPLARLDGADLEGADLSGANLASASLRGANLPQATVSRA